jgi:hypothetical protein
LEPRVRTREVLGKDSPAARRITLDDPEFLEDQVDSDIDHATVWATIA